METEPVIPQFAQMQFNPFNQNFVHQQEQQMLLLQQQQLHHLQETQQIHLQDEEMEADDTTNDMKYNENDMNQMNVTLNVANSNGKHLNQDHHHHNHQNPLQHNNNHQQQHHQHQQQLQQNNQQVNNLKFGRLVNNSKEIENTNLNNLGKQIEEEEYDDEYDDEVDEDDLDDYDEDLIREMMLGASPESQNIIKLIISGFSACASETLRYLIEEENLPASSPVMLGLIEHLKVQETMLIVNCLRTQQFQHQIIKQQQQLASLNQLKQDNSVKKSSKQFETNLPMHQQNGEQQLKKNSHTSSELLQSRPQPVVTNQPHVVNNQVNSNNHIENNMDKNLTGVPLTSSPVNKPSNYSQVSTFNNTLHLAFVGHSNNNSVNNSQNSSQNNSAQNSHSNSPINTSQFYSQNIPNLSLQRQITNTRSTMNTNLSFTGVFNSNIQASTQTANVQPNSSPSHHFFNQTDVLSQYKTRFNDSGFSE